MLKTFSIWFFYFIKIQAQSQAVNLSASSYYVPDFSSMRYLNYGAAVSEASFSRLP